MELRGQGKVFAVKKRCFEFMGIVVKSWDLKTSRGWIPLINVCMKFSNFHVEITPTPWKILTKLLLWSHKTWRWQAIDLSFQSSFKETQMTQTFPRIYWNKISQNLESFSKISPSKLLLTKNLKTRNLKRKICSTINIQLLEFGDKPTQPCRRFYHLFPILLEKLSNRIKMEAQSELKPARKGRKKTTIFFSLPDEDWT